MLFCTISKFSTVVWVERMDDEKRDVLNNSEIDLEKLRESRLQRTREAMMVC